MSLLVKFIFIGFLIYLALKAIAGMFRAIWNDPQAPKPIPPPRTAPRASGPSRAASSPHTAPRSRHNDVEDAQWVDLG